MAKKKYTVGYGKPPKSNRFKKGQSGNPKGRPKGTRNLKTDLAEELSQRIVVTEGGKSRQVSRQQALVKTVIAKALHGDVSAMKATIELILRLLPPANEESEEVDLSKEDQAILAAFERRSRSKNRKSGKPTGECNA